MTNAGKNSKLGELIGKTVMAATREALFRQSGLCPDRQRDVLRILGRFGIDEDVLWINYRKSTGGCGKVSKAEFIDLLDRWKNSSEAVVTAYLLAHLMDLLSWGHICREEMEEMLGNLTGLETATQKSAEQMVRWIVKEIMG